MKPSPSLPQQVFGGNDAVFKNQFGSVAGPQAQLVFFLAGTKALGSLLHDERREPVGVRGAVGHRDHDQNIGIVAVGAERLGAVQHPVVALAHRSHARAAGVRSGGGLGQAPGADELRPWPAADVLLFLRFVAGKKNVVRAQRGVRRDDDADRAVHARELFDGGDVLDIAHAGAAVLGRKHYAQQAELAQFLDGRQRKFAGLVPLHHVGRDFALGKFAHAFLQLQLLIVQLEIQGALSGIHMWIRTQEYRRTKLPAGHEMYVWGGHPRPPPLTLIFTATRSLPPVITSPKTKPTSTASDRSVRPTLNESFEYLVGEEPAARRSAGSHHPPAPAVPNPRVRKSLL